MDRWVFEKDIAKIHTALYDVYQLETSRDKFLRLALLHTQLSYEHSKRGQATLAQDTEKISNIFFEKFLKCMRAGL